MIKKIERKDFERKWKNGMEAFHFQLWAIQQGIIAGQGIERIRDLDGRRMGYRTGQGCWLVGGSNKGLYSSSLVRQRGSRSERGGVTQLMLLFSDGSLFTGLNINRKCICDEEKRRSEE